MNRVICVKGHFYDGDKYTSCPHCAEGVAAIEPAHFDVVHSEIQEAGKEAKKEKKGFFHKKEVKAEVPAPIAVEVKTEMYSAQTEAEPEPIPIPEPEPKQVCVQKPVSVQKPAAEPASSLSSVFSKVSEQPKEKPSDEGKTVGFFSTGQVTEPPVGYLICIAGEDFGIGFPLKSGNNAIGRSQSMDVVVMDPKVSREKQAFVMYEPFKREFYVKPGESSGLCYFNDEVVLASAKMKQYDTIMIGDTKLMLIPVCSDKFSWDEFTQQA